MANPMQASNQQESKTLVDVVQSKVHKLHDKGELLFPENYAHENALKAAWLMLLNMTVNVKSHGGYDQVPVLQYCTQESVINTLLEMVVQGLDPVKKQCYFIPRGNQLTLEPSYFGVMAVTKRVAKATEINAQVIYDGDNVAYEIEDGRIINLKHAQAFGNIDKEKIIGAYCIIKFEDSSVHTEVMTLDEIQQSWSKSKMKKNQNNEGSTHEQFRQEMAKKTVIRRACKLHMNSSSNEDIVARYMKKAEERAHEAGVLEEIQEKANQIPLVVEGLEKPQSETKQFSTVVEATQQVNDVEVVESEMVLEPVHVKANYAHETLQQQPHVEHPNLVDKAHEERAFVDELQLVDGMDRYMNDDVPF